MLRPGSRRLTFVAVAAVLSGVPAFAQTPNGRITGVVREAGGAALEAARVTVTNNGTGATRSTTTAADGAYTVSGLAPGTYTVSALLIGFRRATRTDVQVAGEAAVDFVLEPAPGGGPVPAVAAGLAAIGGEAVVVFVLAADLPLLRAADLGRLLDRLGASPDVDAVAADHRGSPNPLLAVYRVAGLATGAGAGAPASGLLPVRVATVDLGPVATLNVNRPDDLARAVGLLSRPGAGPSRRSSSPP